MMKHKDAYSVAVRKPDGEIIVQKDEYHSIVGKWKKLTMIPFIRGIFNFIDSMVLGIKTLTYSASFYGSRDFEEGEAGEMADGRNSGIFRGSSGSHLHGAALRSILVS